MTLLLILSRAIHFGSSLVLLGAFAVRLLVETPTTDDGRGTKRLAILCLAGAAGSGAIWFWGAVAGMSGSGLAASLSPQLLGMVLTQTSPGHVWMFRGVIGLVLGFVLAVPARPWTWCAGGALAAALVASLAWLGHAGASGGLQRPFMLAGDLAHLIAAGLWPAGLLPFGLCLRRQMKAGILSAARAAVRRFSAMSLITVAVLAASGVVNACFLVGSFHALAATNYGRLLVIKVVLFASAASLGAWNLLMHKPRLEIAPESLKATARNVWIEVALGILIVFVVAIMGTMPPASSL